MSALSAIDAFFVAYQERAGISMALGAELELSATPPRVDVEAALGELLQRMPRLGAHLESPWGRGLRWRDASREPRAAVVDGDAGGAALWRNRFIDPFHEAPFQVYRAPRLLVVKAHHALMDGEAFDEVCRDLITRVAARMSGDMAPEASPARPAPRRSERPDLAQLVRWWRYQRRLAFEAEAERGCRLALESFEPGPQGIGVVALDRERVEVAAARAGVRPSWWTMAAWLRALSGFSRDGRSLVSLEVPVSLRQPGGDGLGNRISPLLLFGDGRASTGNLAQQLRAQLSASVRRGYHLAVPVFSAPGAWLPWPVFRRIAVSPTSTGFATSHFAWFEPREDTHARVEACSGGALRIEAQRVFTPVCLKMGVALSVLPFESGWTACLSYRVNALKGADVERLGAAFAAEAHGEVE